MDYTRGDICLVDFNPAKGGEMGKLRPAILLSRSNELEALATAIVIPLSSVVLKNSSPYRFFLKKREDLLVDSDACIYEITALSKQRIKKRVAKLSDDELAKIQASLCEIVG